MSEAYDDAAERSMVWQDGYKQGQEDLLNEMMDRCRGNGSFLVTGRRQFVRLIAREKSIALKQDA